MIFRHNIRFPDNIIDVQWISEFGHWDIQKTCELSSMDIH